MGAYDTSLLVEMRIGARDPEEAEKVLALLVKALETGGAKVTIDKFEEVRMKRSKNPVRVKCE